jgi:hypothetical protein
MRLSPILRFSGYQYEDPLESPKGLSRLGTQQWLSTATEGETGLEGLGSKQAPDGGCPAAVHAFTATVMIQLVHT